MQKIWLTLISLQLLGSLLVFICGVANVVVQIHFPYLSDPNHWQAFYGVHYSFDIQELKERWNASGIWGALLMIGGACLGLAWIRRPSVAWLKTAYGLSLMVCITAAGLIIGELVVGRIATHLLLL